jgi:hypothetical protein
MSISALPWELNTFEVMKRVTYFLFGLVLIAPWEIWAQLNLRVLYRSAPITLGKRLPFNSNDSIQLDQLKFYIGTKDEKVHFFDLEDSLTHTLILHQPEDSTLLFFGMDSLANTQGRLDGPFDPLLGMYWAWNTGYIQIKISGVLWTSVQSFPFEYHVGGYRQPYITHYQKMVSLHNRIVNLSLEGFLSALPIQDQPKIMMPGPRAWTLYQHFVSSFP